MMDNFEDKLNETLKMLRDEPPDTLTNQVMAKIRVEGKSAKKPFSIWIGVGSAAVCLLVAGVVFSTGIFKNSSVPTEPPMALTVADKSMPKGEADSGKVADGTTSGAEDSTIAKMVPQPKSTVEQSGAGKDNSNKASRQATPEEIKEMKRTPGMLDEKAMEGMPAINLSVKSTDTWKAWTDLRYNSGKFSTKVTSEVLTKEKDVSDSKKLYKMTVSLKAVDFAKWLEMAKKTVGDVSGPMVFNTMAGMIDVTITFSPK